MAKQIIFSGEKASEEKLEYIDSDSTDVSIVEKLDDETRSISDDEKDHAKKPPTSARDLVTEVLSVDDDPTLSPWTFRTWFIGLGLSIFAATITSINTFRPQAVHIDTVFVVVISHIMGTLMAKLLPSKGRVGRFINPGPWNKKEHSAACIMVSAASSTPEAMHVLAVQKLFYNINPTPVLSIFLILSTQMLGFGMAGILKRTMIYPSKMLYPSNIPTASLLDNLHRDREATRKRMRIFYIGFVVLFVWQVFPQYIMPVLAGISIFCLAHQDSLLVTNLFGGVMSNEGLGFLGLSLDWTSITSGGNPLWMPLQSQINSFAGYILSIGLFMGLFYSNHWDARKFPFLSPLMFTDKSTPKQYMVYNQSAILDKNYKVQNDLLEAQGLPFFASSHIFGQIIRNLGITATITHMLVWHWEDIKSAFQVIDISQMRKVFNPKEWNLKFWNRNNERMTEEEAGAICPHYRLMLAYDEVPNWWFAAIWIVSATVGLITSMTASSTLPWWAFFVAVSISLLSLIFFASLSAMFGFHVSVQPLIQMIGAFLVPGKPIANMYFATFGFNSLHQAMLMMKDLKLGQYVHLAPKCTFIMQVLGTAIGCVCSYVMMETITTEKRDILMSIQGTNIWSGQALQSQNSGAVGWGGLAAKLYSPTGKYPWISLAFLLGLVVPIPFWLIHKAAPKLRLDYWNTAIIASAMGMLEHGTHSGKLVHYMVGLFSQLYLRKYRTNWFIKYNYVLSAGLDGGAAFIGFILTFSVFGAGGKVVPFPKYWGNNWHKGNYDFCMKDPGLGSHGKHK